MELGDIFNPAHFLRMSVVHVEHSVAAHAAAADIARRKVADQIPDPVWME
jgi:hypothetical protein